MQVEFTDASIIKLRACRFVKESTDRFGIIRRAGMSRVIVRGTGLAVCELFRNSCAIRDAKLHLAKRCQVPEDSIDLRPLLRSLQKADLIASVDGKSIPEAHPPSFYSAYRYYLRFHAAPRLLRLAYEKLPVRSGKRLAYWVQRLDMRAILWPKALAAEERFASCPHNFRSYKRHKFASRYFSHMVQNIVDFESLTAMPVAQAEDWFSRHVEYEGLEHLARLKSEGIPVIVGAFHFSTTKFLALLLMRRGYDTTQVWLPDGSVDMAMVQKRLAEIENLKPEFGRFRNIPDFSLPSYRRLIQSVRGGDVLVWLADMFFQKEGVQGDPEKEAWRMDAAKMFGLTELQTDMAQSRLAVTLRGQRVYLNSWIGAFARLTRAAVIPAALIRQNGRMRMILKPELRLPDGATAKDVEALNSALFNELDSLLELYPEQWFGWHRLSPVQ
jgi:lauroyl/myristoyl acyltransferase